MYHAPKQQTMGYGNGNLIIVSSQHIGYQYHIL